MVNTAMIQCFVDIFMNVVETYSNVFPPVLASITRTVFNVLTTILTYFAYAYVKAYSQDQNNQKSQKFMDATVWVLLALFGLCGVANIFTGFISYVDADGVYHNGPLYIINYVVPFIFLIFILITALKRRKSYTGEQFRAILFFIILVALGVLVEFAVNYSTLTIMFGVSLALLIIQLSLETPDYRMMIATMNELRQSNLQVEEARKAAEAANRAKSAFLARMSHEIRTPMNAILGMNEVIIKETEDTAAREYAKDAYQSAANLLNIINDILDFSRVESGKLSILPVKYSTLDLLREEYTIFTFKAEEKGINLVFDIDPQLPSEVMGDCVRVKQVITNLLNNAIKYTDKGTVTLRASFVEATDNVANIRFEIIDTGRGIKEENLSRLFLAFERIDEQYNHNIEGTGLGLNIASVLLNMMNSSLKVESEYGAGSTFSFVLPQEIVSLKPIGVFTALEQVSETPKTAADELIYNPDLRILAVDDNMVNLKVFEGLLKKTGARITRANSGAAALELTKVNKYDIIFMDHMMPEMDGVEAMNAIKSQVGGQNLDTPIIVLTANAIKGSFEEYMNIGFSDVCYKPTTQKDLNEKLKTWCA